MSLLLPTASLSSSPSLPAASCPTCLAALRGAQEGAGRPPKGSARPAAVLSSG